MILVNKFYSMTQDCCLSGKYLFKIGVSGKLHQGKMNA